MKRASDRFATVFAAGALAIRYGILPWHREELLRSILKCQLDGLRSEEDPNSASVMLRAKLVSFLKQNRKVFTDLTKQRPKFERDDIDAVPGYYDKHNGDRWFYLTRKRLEKIIGRDDNAVTLKHALAKEGLLATSNNRFVVQRRIFRGGKGNKAFARVHAFKSTLLS